MIRQAAAAPLWRRRPLTTASLSLTGAAVAYACGTEYRAHRLTAQYYENNNNKQHPLDGSIQNPIVRLPREYDWDAVHAYWAHRPVTAAARLGEILWHSVPLAGRYLVDFVIRPRFLVMMQGDNTSNSTTVTDNDNSAHLQEEHAARLRQTLTALGPAFVKAGQQLSIRPDLLPALVLKELQRLCDEVEPVPDAVALRVLRDELGVSSLTDIFVDTPRRVASASLGQVYCATLKQNGAVDDEPSLSQQSGKVAIKIQRPDMLERFSLDLYILQRIGVAVDKFTSLVTHQPPFHQALYESFARGSYQELDYEHEAAAQNEFRRELAARQCPVVVPRVYPQYTSRTVLTSEWIDGIKLADATREDLRRLIPVGVELFLTQLLDIGKFHA